MGSPIGNTTFQPSNIYSQVSGKVSFYLARALAYIDYIIRMIQSSSPFFEKYRPVFQDIPKMYHLVKAFQEVKNNQEEKESENNMKIEGESKTYNGPSPKLFI